MKRLVKGFFISLSMFSTVPLRSMWDQKALHWVMPTFPVVGLVIGGLWYGIAWMLMSFEIPLMLQAVGVLLVPLLLTGGIHLDGYMDVADAVSSRADLKKKQAILVDPHIGAFAAMALGVYLLAGFAVVYSLIEMSVTLWPLVFIPIWSRCLAGLILLIGKPMKKTGFVAMFRENNGSCQIACLWFWLTLSTVVAYVLGGLTLMYPLVAVLISGLIATVSVGRKLDGINGDVCGFVITVSELAGLFVLIFI